MHNLSADVELFHNVDLKMREKEYPRRLVFIGRFSKEKGLAYLLEAWNTIPDRKNWKLVLIGNGPDYPKLKGYPDVEIKDFMPFLYQEDKFADEYDINDLLSFYHEKVEPTLEDNDEMILG